jgi:membrane protein DedA with SNARE-associated domain
LADSFISLAGLLGADLSRLTEFASLLVLPFAHEDLAIVFGAYIIVNDIMPYGLVAATIYGGMVASDFALYGIGAGARYLPWLSRYAVDAKVVRLSDMLKRNLFGLFALCRLVPGVVFCAFVACGWARVSLARFTIASLVVSAVYLPLMLFLMIAFGNALVEQIGFWTWPALFGALMVGGLARKRVFSFGTESEPAQPADAAQPVLESSHNGMPALVGLPSNVAPAERIPPMLFYVPLLLTWIGLALRHRSLTLPSAANPRIVTGGMWGESKSAYFDDVDAAERKWIADYVVIERGSDEWTLPIERERAMRLLAKSGLEFPIIAKPDIGWHGYGVYRIDHRQALHDYLAGFPAGEKIILQRYVPYAGEAAILYARLPGDARGRILSMTFRYFPHVVGNGRSTLRELIRRDPRARWKANLHLGGDPTHCGLDEPELARVPKRGETVRIAMIGNQRAGGLYRDARRFITPALEARIDGISTSMADFHYGRFDIRFETAEALARGEGFSVVEINGIGGEAIDAWDPTFPVSETYRRLIAQQRLLFVIGARNRARGFRPAKASEFVGALMRQTRLIRRYPQSC